MAMKILWFLFIMFACVIAGTLAAHESHHSLASMDFNKDTGRFETALKLVPEQFEAALSLRQGKAFQMDDGPTSDPQILEYLWEAFYLLDATGKRLDLIWVGKEISHEALWLYFEYELNDSNTLEIHNKLMFELEPEQVNVVIVNYLGQHSTFNFVQSKQTQRLHLEPESKAQ